MAFIEDNLQADEEIIHRAAVSKIAGIIALSILATIMLPMGVTGMLTTQLALTNKRVIGTTGMFRKRMITLAYKRINRFTVSQSPLGHLFGYGTVIVSGEDGNRVKFNGIKRPKEIQAIADAAIEDVLFGKALEKIAATPVAAQTSIAKTTILPPKLPEPKQEPPQEIFKRDSNLPKYIPKKDEW